LDGGRRTILTLTRPLVGGVIHRHEMTEGEIRPTNIRYPTLTGARLFPKFTPRDTIAVTSKAALVSTFFGFNIALIKGNLGPQKSIFGGLRANARYVWLYGAVGTAYTFVEAVSANLREHESPLNSFLGGAFAGGIMGATCKFVVIILGS
jgi:hypothetical protein